MRISSDILIVGAGVIGLSIARELRKRGAGKIRVLEKGQAGCEASWAAAGILAPQVEAESDGEFFRLCLESNRMYRDFAAELYEETGKDIEYSGDGVLSIGFSEEDEAEFHRIFDWQTAAGLNIERLDRTDLTLLEPQINKMTRYGLLFPDDGQVENRKLVDALAAFAAANEIVIEERQDVSKIIPSTRHISVATRAGDYIAEMLVLATGAWTSLIKLREIVVPIQVKPMKGQMISYDPHEAAHHVVYSKRGYLVPRRDGRLLVGSTIEDVGFDKSVTTDAESKLIDIGSEIIPALRGEPIIENWSGLRPFIDGGEPFIGPIPGYENLVAAVGHFRNGILLAPITAKMIADQICK